MPANNSKIISPQLLQKLNLKYNVSYDKDNDRIIVALSTCKRVTIHDANKPFHINAKKYNRKICFNMTVIDIWKQITQNKSTAYYSIFDVQNAATMLKVMYQPVTKDKILALLKQKFNGIKKI